MKYILRFFTVLAMFGASAVFAHDYTVGSMTIDSPWSRATVAGIPNGVAYFVVQNNGDVDDRLLSASSPVADKAELHTHLRDGEVVRMRQVDDIAVPAGKSVALEPGGLHVMLMGLKEPLHQGNKFPLTLEFEQAGSVTVEVMVQLLTGAKAGQGSAGNDGNAQGGHAHH